MSDSKPETKEEAPPEEAPGEVFPTSISGLDANMDVYPLREAREDPRWAVWIVWIWVGFTLACLAGILALLILGAIYD